MPPLEMAEVTYIVRHPAGVRELPGGVGTPFPHTGVGCRILVGVRISSWVTGSGVGSRSVETKSIFK